KRRASELGQYSITEARTHEVPETLNELVRLHSLRWKTRNGAGVLQTPEIQAFHQSVAVALMKRGFLRLYRFMLQGETIAVFYGFSCKGRTCYYIGGFDPAFSNVSPGTLLIEHAVLRAQQEGASYFDFLRGQEP